MAIAAVPGGTDTTLPTPVANPLDSPTAIAPILSTGRALILEKGGAVRVMQSDATVLAADALTLGVCTGSEQGLLGAAVSRNFASDGFVYLYYSRDAGNCSSSSGRFNRVSRFTMSGNTISPASEVVLLDNMAIPAGNHNGGDLEIGNDGDLYVSVGDGGSNPRGSGPSAAQDLSLLNGKILRITTSGGVPADNPLVGAVNAQSCATAGIAAPGTAECTEIYASGLRNPFRFAFDPNTSATRFFINDVGQGTWEEVDSGGKGRNYGWDSREGLCNVGSLLTCPPTPAGFTDPLTVYSHDTGCSYITAGAFIPNGIWAAPYDGGYLFADGGCGKIFLMTGAGAVDYDTPFAQTSGVIADMAFMTQPAQTALYYVTNAASELHRITLPPPPASPVTPPTPQPSAPIVPPVVPAPAGTDPAPVPAATKGPRCRIASVAGLLASTARAAIRARHCTPHQVVIRMRGGRPQKRNGKLLPAASPVRPVASPGRRRTWTLRVQRTAQTPGRLYTAGTRQTIWVGWEATPSAVAHRRGARYR